MYTQFAYLVLTTWSRVLLENPTVSQLVKKFPAFVEHVYHVYKSPLPVPVLSQINPFYAPPILLPEEPSEYSSLIYACVFQVVISLRFIHQAPGCTCAISHTCYMPRPFHSSRFDHSNIIW